jgi:uncharacterized protein involved in exopolysaccharide biosynthesis
MRTHLLPSVSPGSMNTYAPPKLRQIVTEAVFRRRRIVLLTVYIVLAAVVLLSVLMHKKYEANAKLMVQTVRSAAPLSTSPTDKLVQNGDVSTTEVNSEVDLLQSTDVARRALEGPNSSGRPTTALEQEKVITLQHHLTVEPVHQTSLINVKLLANSPEEAEMQLQAILNAYFDVRANSGRSSGAAEFFEHQVEAVGKQLDADRKALTDFEVQHNLADLDDQKKLQVTRIATLEDRLADADATLARQQSKTFAERRQLSMTPSRSTTTQRTITNQYQQEHLATALVDLQNRRTELLKRYPPSDRQVVEINDKIATTQRAITDARSNPADETATDINPVWQTLNASVATSTGEVSGLVAQRAELVRQKKEADARLNELQTATGDYDMLKRKLQQTQADYTVYAQKRDEARISEALDKEKMFDVSLVARPTASLEPVRPKPVLYVIAGLVFALLLGTALALYADTSAAQVYTPSQLDALTGTRTIATFADEDDADGHAMANGTELRRVLASVRSSLADTPRAGGALGGDGRAVAFVSALMGEGVSYLVSNIASEASAQASSKVAVLDMRGLLRRFEIEGTVGFALKNDERRGFWVLAATQNGDDEDATPAMPMSGGTQGQFSARLIPLLLEARRQFDFIFLDCPSLQESTLAEELDICIDGYVAVVSAAGARKQNIEGLDAALKETRAPLLGYVLNRRRYPVPRWLHRMMW